MRAARNVAIVMFLALAVAALPHGGNAVEAILAALVLAMLAGIAWSVYTLGRRNQLTLAALSDRRRALLYGALGLLALLVAGYDQLVSTGRGTLAWVVLLGVAFAAIWRVWADASSY